MDLVRHPVESWLKGLWTNFWGLGHFKEGTALCSFIYVPLAKLLFGSFLKSNGIILQIHVFSNTHEIIEIG